MINNTNTVTKTFTDELLNVCANKFFKKPYNELDVARKNYCCKNVLNYINVIDGLNTEIELTKKYLNT